MSKSKSDTLLGAVAGGVLLGALGVAGAVFHFSTKETVADVLVTGKAPAGRTGYLIYTDVETFQNSDSLFALKYNSSDVYGQLRDGMRCSFEVTGWRIPFLSQYRNIVAFTCTEANDVAR